MVKWRDSEPVWDGIVSPVSEKQKRPYKFFDKKITRTGVARKAV